jgi:hypothetical protein
MLHHHIAIGDQGRPSSPSKHADRISTCAAFSTNMVAVENAYHSRGLITIMVCDDPWLRVSRDSVREAAAGTLEIPCHDVGVKVYPSSGFLLLLPLPELRDHLLACNGGLTVGHAKL